MHLFALVALAGEPDADALARAEAAATALVTTLKERVQAAMAEGGPAAAVAVCAGEAPAIAARVSAETGVRVGRSSSRLRNPDNAPPPWVADWLAAQGDRPASTAAGLARVDPTPDGRVARVVKPIAVQAPCLVCHGDPATLAPDVRAALAERYAADRATGYREGDLRGAVWAETALR